MLTEPAIRTKKRRLKERVRSVLPKPLYRKFVKSYNLLSEVVGYFLIPYYRYKNTGRGSYVARSAHVIGWKHVLIGEHSIVSEGTWLNVNHRIARTAHIIIGRNSLIGQRNLISSGAIIKLGDYCLTGQECKFIGANHIIEDPFVPYVTSGATSAVIELGPNCWLGAGVTIVGNVKIGHGCVIGANTLVNSDIPPFSIAVGNPARVVKRFDMEAKAWVRADTFSEAKEALLPDCDQYQATLATKYPLIDLPKRAAGKSLGDML